MPTGAAPRLQVEQKDRLELLSRQLEAANAELSLTAAYLQQERLRTEALQSQQKALLEQLLPPQVLRKVLAQKSRNEQRSFAASQTLNDGSLSHLTIQPERNTDGILSAGLISQIAAEIRNQHLANASSSRSITMSALRGGGGSLS